LSDLADRHCYQIKQTLYDNGNSNWLQEYKNHSEKHSQKLS